MLHLQKAVGAPWPSRGRSGGENGISVDVFFESMPFGGTSQGLLCKGVWICQGYLLCKEHEEPLEQDPPEGSFAPGGLVLQKRKGAVERGAPQRL